VHPSLSDENATVYEPIPLLNKLVSPANTADNPLTVTINFTQLPKGNWAILLIASSGNKTYTTALTSAQYGPTWNTTPAEGIDAVRYFTSQGGVTPGGPLEWKNMFLWPSI
jgi:hypothetical protein